MSEAASTPQQAEKKVEKRQLPPGRIVGHEFAIDQHCVTAEEGTTIEEILDPAYWSHVAPRLKPYAEITIRTDDGLWWAKLIVLVAGKTWAKVKVIQHVPLSTSDVDQTAAENIDGYEIKWRGPLCKWSVIRSRDHQLLTEKHETRGEAQGWLSEHIKAIA